MNRDTVISDGGAGSLAVKVFKDRQALGIAAARDVAAYVAGTIREKGGARIIFACAPSQNEFLDALTNPRTCGAAIDWTRVTVFHMDDYVGLTETDRRSFRSYLHQHLLCRVPVARYHLLPAEDPDIGAVCARYTELLQQQPIDLICCGIGENGHIAFNDPPVADFSDPETVKCVELDLACRRQQVNDGCFARLADVPRRALTLTVPVFRAARRLSIHVPGERKATAVRDALQGSISTACPASILRTHPSATLYLDRDSAVKLDQPAARATEPRSGSPRAGARSGAASARRRAGH